MRILAETSPVETEVQLGGTQLGLLALEEGRADLAACSRFLTDEERSVSPTLLALDAIAVAVHPDNPVRSLTSSQLRLVFEGKITDWRELGGAPGRITVIGREPGSGTRTAFETALDIRSPVYGKELGETGIVRTAVSVSESAIGYFSADYLDDSVCPVAVDGVLPTGDTVLAGEYPLVRPFYLCTRAGEASDRVCRFLDYAKNEGAVLLKEHGFLLPDGEEPIS